jgi:hypothetical protein
MMKERTFSIKKRWFYSSRISASKVVLVMITSFLTIIGAEEAETAKIKTHQEWQGIDNVPTTYLECIQADQKYHIEKSTLLKCVYTVFEQERANFDQCEKLKGIIISGPIVDDFANPQLNLPDSCQLSYYNSDYVFPKTFEDCRDTQTDESILAMMNSQGKCTVAIESGIWGIANKEIAERLREKCLALGGEDINYPNPLYDHTKCVMVYERNP